MLDSETILLVMLVIMFYTIWRYPKLWFANVLYITLIPSYIIVEWANIHEGFSLLSLILVVGLNLLFISHFRLKEE